jgi:hypothetical protein
MLFLAFLKFSGSLLIIICMIFGFFNELYVFKIVEKNKSMFSNCDDKAAVEKSGHNWMAERWLRAKEWQGKLLHKRWHYPEILCIESVDWASIKNQACTFILSMPSWERRFGPYWTWANPIPVMDWWTHKQYRHTRTWLVLVHQRGNWQLNSWCKQGGVWGLTSSESKLGVWSSFEQNWVDKHHGGAKSKTY